MHEELEVLMVFESYLAAAVDRVFKYVDVGVLFFLSHIQPTRQFT